MAHSFEGLIRKKELEAKWDDWDEWILREIMELSKIKTHLNSWIRQKHREKSN